DSIRVGRDEHRLATLLAEVIRKLGRKGRLAAALESEQEDNGWRLGSGYEVGVTAAEHRSQLFIDDRDDLLGPGERLEDVGALGPLTHRIDELTNDAEIDVGLEEGYPNFSKCLVEVLLRYGAVALEPAENLLKLFA